MTQQQQNLVTDNHDLIYFVLRRLGYDIDEHYDTCAIGLCRAAIAFKPECGVKFSTFAVKCMKNEVYKEQKKQRKRVPDTQIDSFTDYIRPGVNVTLQDTVESRDNLLGGKELQMLINGTNLTPRERRALQLRIDGYKNREIASYFGVSNERASQLVRSARSKIQKRLGATV